MSTRTAKILVCDNPDCDNEREQDEYGELLTIGYHFKSGSWNEDQRGGAIPKTYACSAECIAPAILYRIAEEWNA